jgi:TrpR-related protein YerC/YecD
MTKPKPAPGKAPPDPLDALCEALVSLRNREEAKNFLIDLTTPAERRALAERWHVAQLLDQGSLSYRDISEATGVSTTTVVRVARFLREEAFGGYRTVLDRLARKRS